MLQTVRVEKVDEKNGIIYRPVLDLLTVSKIVEGIITDQLYIYIIYIYIYINFSTLSM